jgi:hypothetical protein
MIPCLSEQTQLQSTQRYVQVTSLHQIAPWSICKLELNQGDQIGRNFAYWAIV